MDKFKKAFENKANIGYIVAGYPSLEYSKNFINALDDSALDLLEIGIPYSDPLADGPVIAQAAFDACQNGVSTDSVFEMLKECKTSKCLVFLVYYNMIFAYGEDEFLLKCQECGISGLIVPDLPYEENKSLKNKCDKIGIALIALISVTSGHRAKKILKNTSGFVYMVSVLGVTGGEQSSQNSLRNLCSHIRKYSDLPIAVGFGLKNNADVKATKCYADGAIIGTQIVKASKDKSVSELNAFISELFA